VQVHQPVREQKKSVPFFSVFLTALVVAVVMMGVMLHFVTGQNAELNNRLNNNPTEKTAPTQNEAPKTIVTEVIEHIEDNAVSASFGLADDNKEETLEASIG